MRNIKTENRKSALQTFRRAGRKLAEQTKNDDKIHLLALLNDNGKIIVMADYQCGSWCGDIDISTPSKYKFLP